MTFDQLQDTLERQSAAANVPHVVVSSHPQSIAYGSGAAGQCLTIDQFNPAVDTVMLSEAIYGGINPLDAGHARQITALDGTTDVLISLDPSHSILFEHTALASLHASDFVFG